MLTWILSMIELTEFAHTALTKAQLSHPDVKIWWEMMERWLPSEAAPYDERLINGEAYRSLEVGKDIQFDIPNIVIIYRVNNRHVVVEAMRFYH